MSKKEVKTQVKEAPKQPKTIKLSTVIVSVVILIALIASFIGGIATANHYQTTVKAQAVELSKELKENQ